MSAKVSKAGKMNGTKDITTKPIEESPEKLEIESHDESVSGDADRDLSPEKSEEPILSNVARRLPLHGMVSPRAL